MLRPLRASCGPGGRSESGCRKVSLPQARCTHPPCERANTDARVREQAHRTLTYLEGVALADAVRGAGDDCPCPVLAKVLRRAQVARIQRIENAGGETETLVRQEQRAEVGDNRGHFNGHHGGGGGSTGNSGAREEGKGGEMGGIFCSMLLAPVAVHAPATDDGGHYRSGRSGH